jgi:hypothetical protein
MTRTLDNNVAADTLTLNRLKGNTDKFKNIPALGEDTVELETALRQLTAAMSAYDNLTLGKSAEKMKTEKALIDVIKPVKAKLISYARKQGNEALSQLAHRSVSAMIHMRDSEFLRFAQTIHAEAAELSTPLAHFGLTQQMLDGLKTGIDAFNTAMGDRSDSTVDKSGTAKTITTLVHQIHDLLNNSIDPLVESMEDDEPAFCNEYFATRIVRDHGLRHRKLPEPPTPPVEPPAQT